MRRFNVVSVLTSAIVLFAHANVFAQRNLAEGGENWKAIEGELHSAASLFADNNTDGTQRAKLDRAALNNGLPGGVVANGKFIVLLVDGRVLGKLQAALAEDSNAIRVQGIMHDGGRSLTPGRIEYRSAGNWRPFDLPVSGTLATEVSGGDAGLEKPNAPKNDENPGANADTPGEQAEGTLTEARCYFTTGGTGGKHTYCDFMSMGANLPIGILTDKKEFFYLDIASTPMAMLATKTIRVKGKIAPGARAETGAVIREKRVGVARGPAANGSVEARWFGQGAWGSVRWMTSRSIDCLNCCIILTSAKLRSSFNERRNCSPVLRCGPLCRLVANCLCAELHRGAEDYFEAEQGYQSAIEAGDELNQEKRSTEWYMAYHPRAYLGLITIWRRTLNSNLDEIRDLIATTRDRFKDNATQGAFRIPDFPAQIDAVEGVFQRQIGDSSAALSCMKRAVDGINSLKSSNLPWYVFWYPEHLEAHRVLIYLMAPKRRLGDSRPFAEKLLGNADADPWSRSAALAAIAHDEFDLFLEKRRTKFDVLLEKTGLKSPMPEKARGCLDRLAVEGQQSLDPTLSTEGMMLRAAWCAATGNRSECLRSLALIADERGLDENLTFLRGVETAVIQQNWLKDGDPATPVQCLCERGIEKLERLRDGLMAYRFREEHLDWCRDLLVSVIEARSPRQPVGWRDERLVMLRARLWP